MFTSTSIARTLPETSAFVAASSKESLFAKLRMPAKTKWFRANFTLSAIPKPEFAPVTTATGRAINGTIRGL